MFARRVRMRLKPNVADEFRLAYEKEIIPILRRQDGFLEELVLATPARKEVLAISLWEDKEFADAYRQRASSEVARIVARFVAQPPVIEDLIVEYTTYRKLKPAPALV